MRKELKRLLNAVEDAGCRVDATRGGHYQVFVPDGGIVLISGTSSDHHAMKNALADLRRAGVVL